MNDKRYFDNIRRIEELISQLNEGRLPPEEAKKLFETGKELVEECDSILNCYSGTMEEISFIPASD